MLPIYIRKTGVPEGYSPEQFERAFLSICENHRNEGRALAFAFILYDFEHPEIRKVLEDPHYWDALDQISGEYLTIFSFHLTPKPTKSPASQKLKHTSPLNQLFGYSNRFLEKKFGIHLPGSQPLLLFFQVSAGKFSKPYIYELTTASVEGAFQEIRGAILSAVESIKEVRPENHGNTEEILTLIINQLSARKLFRRVVSAVNIVERVKEFLS
jgi:hypothetical protein